MRLIELDGTRNGPIDRGTCTNLLKVCEKARASYYLLPSRLTRLAGCRYLCQREDDSERA